MNERIRKLYKTAQVPHTAIDPSNNMPYETTCFSPEKFAELLVKETIDMAVKIVSDNNSKELVTYEHQIRWPIEEHFGVKE